MQQYHGLILFLLIPILYWCKPIDLNVVTCDLHQSPVQSSYIFLSHVISLCQCLAESYFEICSVSEQMRQRV